jgi:hypothetical protein
MTHQMNQVTAKVSYLKFLDFLGIYVLLRNLMEPVFLTFGIIAFAVTGKTPPRSYQALINLFCLTKGLSNDCLSFVVSKLSPHKEFLNQLGKPVGILGDLSGPNMDRIFAKLDSEGYYVFEQPLPDDICEKLLNFSLTEKCYRRRMDHEDPNAIKYCTPDIYIRNQPKSIRYDFKQATLVNNKLIQELICDPSLLALSAYYLKSVPLLDLIALWWHTDFSNSPDAEAAQLYHFDLDRIRWLKFFFYITDVTKETGPHCFIAGSHKTDGIPRNLLKKGYARLADEEVAAFYPKEDFITFKGKRGTIIAEDTRGLHKGKHVNKGDRLIFQLQFSNSLFGADHPEAFASQVYTPALNESIAKFPKVFSRLVNL